MALVLALASCGGDDDDTDTHASQTTIGLVCDEAPRESEAALELAQTYCGEIFGCHCPFQDAYGSFEACVASLFTEFQSAFDMATLEGLTYNPGCTQLQLFFAQNLGCDFPDAAIEPLCVDVQCEPFAGEGLVGEPCTTIDAARVSFSDCAPGLSCKPECGGCVDDRRRRAEGEPCGTCFGFCDEGLTCSLPGEPLEGTCVVRSGGAPGDPCQSFLDCSEGLYCPEDICAPRLGEGGDCETGVECALGLYCSAGRCEALKRTGDPCTSSSECAFACSSQGRCSFPLCNE
jgi:hypothetical protein